MNKFLKLTFVQERVIVYTGRRTWMRRRQYRKAEKADLDQWFREASTAFEVIYFKSYQGFGSDHRNNTLFLLKNDAHLSKIFKHHINCLVAEKYWIYVVTCCKGDRFLSGLSLNGELGCSSLFPWRISCIYLKFMEDTDKELSKM